MSSKNVTKQLSKKFLTSAFGLAIKPCRLQNYIDKQSCYVCRRSCGCQPANNFNDSLRSFTQANAHSTSRISTTSAGMVAILFTAFFFIFDDFSRFFVHRLMHRSHSLGISPGPSQCRDHDTVYHISHSSG